ncbi:MAG: pyridoxal phosphate-dependent aminotransferase [Alicyclobacillus sp.]|nr:pyridoxal phosphate-dependent aminotransferase [Alicyclobacillus sp.]
MSLRFAERATRIPDSGIREIANRAMELPGAIRLELGEPDFPTPRHIGEAAARAIAEGKTRYTATSGLRVLRELLAAKLKRVNGIDVPLEQVTVTSGGANAVFAAIASIVNPGDEVLVPSPAWPNYVMQVLACGGVVREYELNPVTFLPNPADLAERFTPRTRILIVNSPGNPTGAVLPRETAEALVDLAVRHNCFLISDEVYDELVFDQPHVSLFPLAPDNVIGIYSFSKTYAMTGWRLGYAVARRDLIVTMERVQEGVVSCASQVSQEAGIAALQGDQSVVAEMRELYRARRDMVVSQLQAVDLYTYTPQGAFYILVNIAASGLKSRAFALELLDRYQVAVAPGSAFGSSADHVVRISLASSERDLREGVTRIAALVAAHRA